MKSLHSWLAKTRILWSGIAGASVTLSFAPFNFWVTGIVGPLVLFIALKGQSVKSSGHIALAFGFGLFASGASWVYFAIHDFGFTSAPLALILTAVFVSMLACVFALPFVIYQRFFGNLSVQHVYLFPAIWVIGEWLRSWLFTGFPWLYLGYGHIDTWLAGWAPIFGVFGVSFIVVFTGTLFYQAAANQTRLIHSYSLALIALIWFSGSFLQSVQWSSPSEEKPLRVATVQPNIDLMMKWDPRFQPYILEVLRTETAEHWDKDLILWPEAAIPMLYHDATGFLLEIHEQALNTNTALISGILYDQPEPVRYFNAIMGLGTAEGIYFKQRLVPFGEYVPLESWLRGLINFFNLPNSVIHAGPSNQSPLNIDQTHIAAYICYEIVYPDLVAGNLGAAEIIVTISNDAWFGDSIGPKQHFQMAQMRALENSRYIVRSTNTGISGVIDHKGKIVQLDKPYGQSSMSAEVEKRQGKTPFSIFGSLPIIIFSFLLLITIFTLRKISSRHCVGRSQ